MSLFGSCMRRPFSGSARLGLGLWAALVFLPSTALAQEPLQLFESVQGPVRVAASTDGPVVARQRLVKLRQEAFEQEHAPVVLNLFPDATYEFAPVHAARELPSGNRVWKARRPGVPGAYAVLVSGAHGVRGNVSDGTGRHYKILPSGTGVQELRQVLPPAVDLRDDAEAPQGSSLAETAEAAGFIAPPSSSAASTAIWDILVVYSAAGRVWAGGTAGMQAHVDLTFAEMNEALEASDVDARVRLAGLVEVTMPGTEATSTAFLNAVTADDDLADLRDQYGADFVSVWMSPGTGGGRAWIMQNVGSGFASNAYAILAVEYADGPSYIFAHETGHNAGLAHDRDNASVNGAYSYSYGYQQKSQTPRFHTIMAYLNGCSWPCPTINQFSNPNVSYEGFATGIASGSNSADNARTLNQTAPVAAAWRDEVDPPAGVPDHVGIFSDGRWVLDSDGDGVFEVQDRNWVLGDFPGAQPVIGDWNGDGQDDAGVFNDGFWFLDANGNGSWEGAPNDRLFAFGWPGVTPVVGDWNGDGRTSVGVYSNGFWFLDYDGNGLWDGGANDKIFGLGWPGVELVIGDWNGDGRDKIGVFSNGFWFLDYDGSYSWDGGTQDQVFGFGWAGVTPLVGDWNGDGKESVAVFYNGSWFFDYDADTNWNPAGADRSLMLGWSGAQPVVGDWNGDGRDKAGLYSSGNWFLDQDGNAIWNSSAGDRSFSWGGPNDIPLPGKW